MSEIVVSDVLHGEALKPELVGKKANDETEARKIQETYAGKPYGWIQWKGTAVCMDVRCACGYIGHVDAEFAYCVECPSCGRVYKCNGHIELIELRERPTHSSIVMMEE